MSSVRIINSVAPTRICDVGGWTDTWYAKRGCVFNIAVYPYVEVQIKAYSQKTGEDRLIINLENYGDTISVDPANIKYGQYPLIEAAIDSVAPLKNMSCEVNIYSSMPPGASAGTSASLTVALIGALDALTEGHLSVAEVARLAHEVETVKLGRQSGIQDQLCAAFGGINYIEMHEYPHAIVSPLKLSDSILWELERRLMLVYIGTPHDSSTVHKKVIEKLGNNAENSSYIEELRKLAQKVKNYLYDGDFKRFGDCLNQSTQVLREMHPDLVCQKFEDIIEICNAYHVLGCKVNGAGGDGGTITVLTDRDMNTKRALMRELAIKGYEVIPISLAKEGLRVESYGKAE